MYRPEPIMYIWQYNNNVAIYCTCPANSGGEFGAVCGGCVATLRRPGEQL